MNRFLDLDDFEATAVEDMVRLATRLEANPQPDALAGKILVLLFLNPSLRTRVSFQAAMARLGGTAIAVSPESSWALETRDGVVMDGPAAEHVKEAVPVLAQYADALGIRAFAGGDDLEADLSETRFSLFDELCPVPLINMESATSHPCQSLADWKTLNDFGVPGRGGRFVLSWADHPKPLPLAVPASTVHMAALRGMDVTVLRPDEYALPSAVMDKARAAARRSGGTVRETSDRKAAMNGAQVLYAKSWASAAHYGDAAAEKALRAALGQWCVEESWFEPAAAECRFMHCLPVRRGVVVRDEVLDGPRSVVVTQAGNRLAAQTAVLYRCLAGGNL